MGADESIVEAAHNYLSRAETPVRLADLCEGLKDSFPNPPTLAALHVLLRLDPRFEQPEPYRWCLAKPRKTVPTVSQVADRIVQYMRDQGKRFLSEEVLASVVANDYSLSPVESLRLVREASSTYSARIPRAGTNIFLAQETPSEAR